MGVYDRYPRDYSYNSYDSYYPDGFSRDPTLTSFGSLQDRPYLAGIDSPYPTDFYHLGDDNYRLDVHVPPRETRYLQPINYMLPRQHVGFPWQQMASPGWDVGRVPCRPFPVTSYATHMLPPVAPVPIYSGGGYPSNEPLPLPSPRERDDYDVSGRRRKSRWRKEVPLSYRAVMVMAVVSCFLGNLICGIPAVALAAVAINKLRRNTESAENYRNIAMAFTIFSILSALAAIAIVLGFFVDI